MAVMKAKTRNNLAPTEFAVPGKRKLPISDAAHVRNAAARLNQTQGLTPGEKATAQRKIAGAEKRLGIGAAKKGGK